ncbi:uncharacterized protein A4U43_C01F8630 [Asparagus officinalis]|uniref:Uncharacterized protein n=1 Tax=Asparagus officinalis TaxID=4686 RepID=A0A5P1FNG1_ASPOF|nr:uncharacterized protein A4U43_C01F8630 [Asparagus officinalis]
MANQGAKKRKEENKKHMANLLRLIIACNEAWVGRRSGEENFMLVVECGGIGALGFVDGLRRLGLDEGGCSGGLTRWWSALMNSVRSAL